MEFLNHPDAPSYLPKLEILAVTFLSASPASQLQIHPMLLSTSLPLQIAPPRCDLIFSLTYQAEDVFLNSKTLAPNSQ